MQLLVLLRDHVTNINNSFGYLQVMPYFLGLFCLEWTVLIIQVTV
jgi:hypothetical protein